MSRWVPLAVLAVTPLIVLAAQGPAQPPPPWVADELVVQFAASSPSSRRAAILASENSQDIARFESLDVHHVRLPRGRDVQQAVAAFMRQRDVIAAQPNYIRQAVGRIGPSPNDPLWIDGTLWGLEKIQAQPVWTGF